MAEYDIPDELRYSEEDEWARVEEAGRIIVGITDFAQEQLGDIVYVELPKIGATISKGDVFGVVESVKAVSDLYAPISGEIIEVNADLAESPELVNADCYGDGWMLSVEPSEAEELESLFDAQAYQKHIDERAE